MLSFRSSASALVVQCAIAAWLLCAPAAATEHLRIATYNVLDIGVGTASYTALVDILQRIDADIVLVQEIGEAGGQTQSQSQAALQLATLASDAGYGYLAVSFLSGTLSGGLRVGVLSRYPITQVISHDSVSLSGLASANDLTRDILQAEIAVPDVAFPIAFFTVHLKASGGDVNEFRRAVELRRLEQAISNWCALNPTGMAFVGGDFNWDVGNFTPKSFSNADYLAFKANGLPQTYALGSDVNFPLLYNPLQTLGNLAGCAGLLDFADPTWEDSTSATGTYQSNSRLDYLWSEPSSSGRLTYLVDEIYRSAGDDGIDAPPAGNYLPKYGSGPLAASTSSSASDHYPVVATYRIEDSGGGRLGFATNGQYALAPFAGTSGTVAIGSADFAFTLSQARPNSLAFFLLGAFQFPPISLPAFLPGYFQDPNAFLYVPLNAYLATRLTDAKGSAQFALPLPNNPALIGAPPIYSQWLVVDPLAAGGFAATSDAYYLQF